MAKHLVTFRKQMVFDYHPIAGLQYHCEPIIERTPIRVIIESTDNFTGGMEALREAFRLSTIMEGPTLEEFRKLYQGDFDHSQDALPYSTVKGKINYPSETRRMFGPKTTHQQRINRVAQNNLEHLPVFLSFEGQLALGNILQSLQQRKP